MALLETITKNYKNFKSSPVTFIIFLVVVGFAHNIYTDRKEKTKALEDCETDRNRIYKKFEDLALKVDKVEKNDSVILKTK
jgi:hypothetical protein